jgi:O-acetylserine/cysteine efflux transporter
MGLALAGLATVATTLGADLTALGLGLTLLSAVSWGIGNVLVKGLPQLDMLALVVWLSLVPPVPALALSVVLDGPAGLVTAVTGASWVSLAAVMYLGVVATLVGYAIWGRLLRRYPAATVTPFALLAPFVAAWGSRLVFDERFGLRRLVGMALVLLALAIIVLPRRRAPRANAAALGAGRGVEGIGDAR